MTYLKKISEQIIRIYNAGNPSSDKEFEQREVYLLIQQVLNRLLKTEHVNIHLPLNEYVPPHAVIATYEDVEVTGTGSAQPKLTCTPFDVVGFSSEWQTEGGLDWTTAGGDPWVLNLQDAELEVTPVSNFGSTIYTISLTGFALPQGKTASDLKTFIEDCEDGSLIEFEGDEININKFLAQGVSNVETTATSLEFTYNPAATSAANSVILSEVNATHGLLPASQTTYAVKIGNINCCDTEVDSTNIKASVTLPAQPINLPRGMGVWRVYDPVVANDPFIPLASGQLGIVQSITHTNTASQLGGLTAYEYFSNNKLLFNKTIAEMPEKVNIQLLVVDPEQVGEFDMLPIPADMEDIVIRDVLQLMGQAIPDQVVDNNKTK